jgi:hypothetical protein
MGIKTRMRTKTILLVIRNVDTADAATIRVSMSCKKMSLVWCENDRLKRLTSYLRIAEHQSVCCCISITSSWYSTRFAWDPPTGMGCGATRRENGGLHIRMDALA